MPSCAIWNFLDNELEIDVPFMNVEEWSDFVRGRFCADQKRMTLVMTRVLVQARMMDRTCQVMYNEIWKLQDRLHSEKGKVEVMVRTCDSARREPARVADPVRRLSGRDANGHAGFGGETGGR